MSNSQAQADYTFGNEHPANTVLFCDIDGTLAAIDPDATKVSLSPSTLALLTEALDSLAAVACVTGRDLEIARKLVPIEGMIFAACHGMHMRFADGAELIDPTAQSAAEQLELARTMAHTVGWSYEDKKLTISLHFRHSATPDLTARQMRDQISTVLDPSIIEVRDARMALELIPIGARNKGDAVRDVLANTSVATYAVAIGDDRTDIDMFEVLRELSLPSTSIAINSAEAPAELLESADIVVDSQAEIDAVLRAVLRGSGVRTV